MASVPVVPASGDLEASSGEAVECPECLVSRCPAVSGRRSDATPRRSIASSQRGSGVSRTTRREFRSRRSTQKRGSGEDFLETNTTRDAHWLVLLRIMPFASMSFTASSIIFSPAVPVREGACRKGREPGLRSTETSSRCVVPGTLASVENAAWCRATRSSARARRSGDRIPDSSIDTFSRARLVLGGRRFHVVSSGEERRSCTTIVSNSTWQMGMSDPTERSRCVKLLICTGMQ